MGDTTTLSHQQEKLSEYILIKTKQLISSFFKQHTIRELLLTETRSSCIVSCFHDFKLKSTSNSCVCVCVCVDFVSAFSFQVSPSCRQYDTDLEQIKAAYSSIKTTINKITFNFTRLFFFEFNYLLLHYFNYYKTNTQVPMFSISIIPLEDM